MYVMCGDFRPLGPSEKSLYEITLGRRPVRKERETKELQRRKPNFAFYYR